jgi:iron complex outermembrane receptor protein
MSELMNIADRNETRRRLLSTASALALLTAIYVGSEASAADDNADRPAVWIELGGDMDRVTGQGDPFAPHFLSVYQNSSVLQKPSPTEAQNPTPFGFGGDGIISFQPEESNWVFVASFRYGRSNSDKQVHHQTTKVHHAKYNNGVPTTSSFLTQENFARTKVSQKESHAILDFMAGKDVGLGIFGRNGSSILSFGVRIAQFSSKETVDIRARPDLVFKYVPVGSQGIENMYFHTYHASGSSSRNFRGVGPSVSWSGSAPFVGNTQTGEIALDWGANAALLFGRQKAHVLHQESGIYVPKSALGRIVYGTLLYHDTGKGHDTDRTIIVPNVGAFAGASYNFPNARVSIGYRADFFFDAMDVGIDKRKSETLVFYGPFAGVSVGLGG